MNQFEVAALMASKKFTTIGPNIDGYARVIDGQELKISGKDILAQKSLEHLRLYIDYLIDSAYADSAIAPATAPLDE